MNRQFHGFNSQKPSYHLPFTPATPSPTIIVIAREQDEKDPDENIHK
jgi:hypothetical protein